ncbi:MAG: AAA family ATPase [Hyphomicrobium sp.]
MKITAIRLKEVGRFSAPVALEGLTGGLDVLAGPNEFGKSTILKAVRAALFEQHRSKHRKLETLRPYAGGAPLVEIDFEVAGGRWRIRKQFLSSPGAELRDLNSGSIARGADAEARLAELLGGAGHHALLCVEQGAPLAPMTPVETGGRAFAAAIERELESIADGSATRIVAERVKEELSGLLTSHNPPRPTGALKAALDERDALSRQHGEAQQRLSAAQARLDKLEALRARLSQLSEQGALAAGDQAAADARRAFEEAREARQKRLAAEQSVGSCQQQLDAVKLALDIFDQRAGELAKLERDASDAAPVRADLEARAATGADRLAEARTYRDEIKSSLAALQHSRRALELADRLAAARGAHEARTSALAELSGNAAEEKLVDAARREAAEIARLKAHLSAAAPRVALRLEPRGAGKIKVDGRPLADGEVLSPIRPVTLEIEGIGTITIAPGQSDDVASDAVELQMRQDRLAGLLQRAGAPSLDDAERLLIERRSIEAEIAAATAQLKASAPEGLERLQRLHDDILEQAVSRGAPSAASLDDLETRAQELVEALGGAEEAFNAAAGEERIARDALTSLRARSEGQAEQMQRLTAELGTSHERTIARQARLDAFEDARTALNAAVRELAAWREKAPDEARFAELKHAAEAAEAARQRAKDELTALHRIEAGIEGELRTDRADDVAASLDELAGRLTRAEARCRDLLQEAGALQLLGREFDAAAARTRDRFARPVIERLAPYLQLVMPHAQLLLGDDLAPRALQRGVLSEDLLRLSDGTQEQLALLVRLAFARLLADSGTPAPLILDDALAYAGDERIGRMFMALRHAAREHQVLVLTCRERAFAELGGARIALTTWDDKRAAA